MPKHVKECFVLLLVILLGSFSVSNCRADGECCCTYTYSTKSSPRIIGSVNWCCGSPVEVCEGNWTYFFVNVQDIDRVSRDCDNDCCEDCDDAWDIGGSPTASWSASDGTPASQAQGSAFGWYAPTLDVGECERTVTITATPKDGATYCPYPSECNHGNCKDGSGSPKSIQVKVVKCSCDDLDSEVTAGSFDPDPVCVGEETTLQPTSEGVPEDACTCDEGADVEYSWTFTAKKDTQSTWQSITPTSITGGDTSSPTVKFEFASCGNWEVKAACTVSWINEVCAGRCTADGDDIATVTVVGIEKIVRDGSEDETPTVCGCSPFTLRAIPCPEEATFLEVPVWTLESAPQAYRDNYDAQTLPKNLGTGDTLEFYPHEISGTYSFKAACCNSSDTITVTVSGAVLQIQYSEDGQNYSDVTDTTVNTVVGCLVPLKVVAVQPPGATLSEILWEIDGNRIFGYDASQEEGKVYPMDSDHSTESENDDLDNVDVFFRWVRGGTLDVSVMAKINNDIWCEAKVTFQVAQPTVTIPTIDSQDVIVQNQVKLMAGSGATASTAGVYFIGAYSSPPAGTLKWIQKITTLRRKKKISNNTWYRIQKESVLDGNVPYPASNLFAVGDMFDSPGHAPGPEYSDLEITESFESYLMFEPDCPGTLSSIPVPFIKVTWSWHGTANNTGSNTWVLGPDPEHPDPQQNDTTEFPEWTDYVTGSEEYIPEP